MGTQFRGKRPKNDITVSRSSTPKKVDPATGWSEISGEKMVEPADRSFAQQSPVAPAKQITPKVHASKEAEAEALKRNSTKKNDEVVQDEDAATGEE